MRNELRAYEGQRMVFTGVVCRIGSRRPFRGSRKKLSTILLRDVKNEEGEIITDHIWLDLTPPFVVVHPRYGDIIKFTGVVESYVRGISSIHNFYNTGKMSLDYTIHHINDISVIDKLSNEDREEMLKWYDDEKDKDFDC